MAERQLYFSEYFPHEHRYEDGYCSICLKEEDA